MPSHKKYTPRNWFCWLLLLLIQVAQAADQSTAALSNANLHLDFNLSSGAVQHWSLPQLRGASGHAQDMAAPKGQLFLLSGELDGKSLADWQLMAGGWKIVEQQPNAIVIGLESPELPFSIRKTWRLQENQWRVDFALDLDLKSLKTSPTDHLVLQVGPGIGEIPATGLGMGQSIYSFTELVYRNAEGITTVRLNNTDRPVGYTSHEAGQWSWVGLQSRYLALIMTPSSDLAKRAMWQANTPQTLTGNAEYDSFETSINILLPVGEPGSQPVQSYQWSVFGGGKAYAALIAQTPELDGLLFSGLWDWMRWLSLTIMHLLHFIQQIVGSWGIAIILLAVLVRLAVYPIAKNAILAQKKFSAIQARIQPELQEIRKNYKGGEQSERILQLYEYHKVSPLAGLKPLLIVLIQVPIFISLYHLLGQTFELRDASFLWMKTLAEPDQLFSLGIDLPLFGSYFNLLPVLMSLTTILSIKLNPTTPADGTSSLRQSLTTGLMGLGFFLLFYSFPSGMVLYWTVANILQVAHQKIVKAA
ncbi:YidC/Oxa1 family membrane protein insertase [Pseudomonas marginalis]|uniref:YidC/Oxa1 family membrane protein insertase n=1 Tax=Pseudomonas marginalis TaxID=298 RepID=UPI00209E1774|nr:YidC/Oxa1 family membrane protein insertase [Pseudomonas marginalis]MCP1505528.1 YidC/Oxa1 family membrane protein insertase [Pseudomonas marginalis]MCP1523032.1 YidC/Oxa1 family membrane protein insertase [Pseudomonas marginalis]MDQ0497650.1 YidC/Oxa1 family membrane protein insertase [Pseudomonas marginalis]